MPVLQTDLAVRARARDIEVLPPLSRMAEYGLVFILLILFSEGLLPRLLSSGEEADGSPILRLLWLPVYGLTLVAFLWSARETIPRLLRMPFMTALITLAAISFIWSIDPGLSLRRGIAILMTCLFGVVMAVRYDWRTMIRLIGAMWVTMAIVSLVSGIVAPSFSIMNEVHVGAWKALWTEKNAMGGHMARAGFICAFMVMRDVRWRRFWCAGVFLCTVLVFLSTSKTALLGLMLGFGVLGLALWLKRGPVTAISTVWLGTAVSAGAIAGLVLAPEAVFGMLGRDATLTGRTDIWAALMDTIAARPWLGYGYGAFWAPDSMPAYWVRVSVEWPAPTAHNGWLDVALSVGLIGLFLMVANFILSFIRAIIASVDQWTGVFAAGVLVQFALFSVSESIALQQNAIVWLTYVAVVAKLAASKPGDDEGSDVPVRRRWRLTTP